MSERDNTRDTQFQGFARSLLNELMRDGDCLDCYEDKMCLIIARRAYDLAIEVAKEAIDGNSYDEERDARHIVKKMGDMTELPKEIDDSVSIYESLCNDEGVMQVAIQIAKALEPGHPRDYEGFGRIVTFTDEQKQMIQERLKKEQEG